MATYSNDYSSDPSIINPSLGKYIIHDSTALTSLSFDDYAYIKISAQMVDDNIGGFGSARRWGLTDSNYYPFATFVISDDTDNNGISTEPAFNAYLYSGGTTQEVCATWTEISDTNWHKLELEIEDGSATFYIDGVSKGSTGKISGLSNIDRFVLIGGSNPSYDVYDTDEWDGVNENVHFKVRRSDSSLYNDWRWDDLKISSSASDGPTQVVISNTSGCTVSGGTTATISAKVTNSSGNVTFYYESGATGGGTTKGNWDSSIAYGSTVYSGSYITKGLTGLSRDYTYSFRGYISSNGWGGGEDWFDATDTFTTLSTDTTHYDEGNSLRIYVSCNNYPSNYIDCWATRFDEGNWDVTFETFMGSGARNFLFDNVIPQAISEMYNILGTPHYVDTTFSSGNTIILEPQDDYGLSGLREKRTVAIKSISDRFISPNYFSIKVETVRLDT